MMNHENAEQLQHKSMENEKLACVNQLPVTYLGMSRKTLSDNFFTDKDSDSSDDDELVVPEAYMEVEYDLSIQGKLIPTVDMK